MNSLTSGGQTPRSGEAPLRRRVLINAVAGYISKGSDLIISLLLIPFMVARLGDADYGLWILAGSLVSYGALLDFGIASALTKYVAEYNARGTQDKTRRLIASALWLYTAIGALLVAAFSIIAPWVPAWFELDASQADTARWLVLITGTAIGLSIPYGASIAVLKGLHRFEITSLLGTVRFLLFAVGTVIVLQSGGGVLAIGAVQILAMTVIQLPAIWWIYRLAPGFRFGFRGACLSGIRTLGSFSWSLFLVSIGGQLQSRTDEIVIGSRMPVDAVTPYSLARKLSQIPQMLAEQFINLVLPIASELQARQDGANLKLTLTISTRLTIAVFFSLGMILCVLAGPVLALWVGPVYAESAPLVWVLVAAVFFDAVQWPAAVVLQGMNRHRLFAATSLATGIANVGLSLALIPHFGLLGVALGTLIPAAAQTALINIPYALRIVQISPGRLLRESLLPGFLPAVPGTLLLLYYARQVEEPSALALIGIAVAYVVIYMVFYLVYPTNTAERKIFGDLVTAIRRHSKPDAAVRSQ
jgi:O-antigen/teichoic acid export membrane protein